MRLVSITIENYRSITTARKIPIGDTTVLIGPNNEGKSNVLRALATALTELVRYSRFANESERHFRRSPRYRTRRDDRSHLFDWETDFPLTLQAKESKKQPTIALEFLLNEEDRQQFYAEIGNKINDNLQISLSFEPTSLPKISILKQGPGGKALNRKTNRVALFVAQRVGIQYIPAVRTEGAAHEIVREMVSRELHQVESDPKYQQALADIAELQRPIIEALSEKIGSTMMQFLPQIKRVRINIDSNERSLALRTSAEVFADDGIETALQYKGDGVQSLAAIAIMRHSSQLSTQLRDQIIALEEPESHLHPAAIRELRAIISDLSKENQVVLTTHNPLFANVLSVQSNIIVSNNRAAPARSIAEVRKVLGVRLSDNLTSADTILIVEGDEDRMALTAMISDKSELLKSELSTGRLVIDVLGGAPNLSHRIRMYSDALCHVHVFLDDDQSGRSAFKKAKADAVISDDAVNFAMCAGKNESELEDLYKEEVFQPIIREYCGLEMPKAGTDKKKKWADRARAFLRQNGKHIDDVEIETIKKRIARKVEKLGSSALVEGRSGPINSLVASLEETVLRRTEQ